MLTKISVQLIFLIIRVDKTLVFHSDLGKIDKIKIFFRKRQLNDSTISVLIQFYCKTNIKAINVVVLWDAVFSFLYCCIALK